MTEPTSPAMKPSKKNFDLEVKSFFGGIGSYLEGLGQVNLPAEARARNPLMNHPWVFAASMVTAVVASQAPFGVWRETEKTERTRERTERRKGRSPYPKSGMERRAMLRHDVRKVAQRVMHKGIEQDDTHPILSMIENPNPFQDGGQLWFMTHMLLAAEGEVMWVLTDENGNPNTPVPTRIYPMRGEFMTEVFSHGQSGDLIGFHYRPPTWMPGSQHEQVFVPIISIIHFKFTNPFNPVRGFSRLTPSGAAVESSLLAKAWNRSTLRNSGVPKGVVNYEGIMEPNERSEFLAKWKDKFEGPENQGRTALLSNGFKYQNIALSPNDMQFDKLGVTDREEILAVMQTPKTVLGLTDSVNFATSQGQDRNFWDKSILPLMSLEEKAVDQSIFFMETDNTFGAFDLGAVESLRIGLESKVKLAHQLTDGNLHMPPSVAYNVVGIEVEDYPGIDVCLIKGLATPVEDVLDPLPLPPLPQPIVPTDPAEDVPTDPAEDVPTDQVEDDPEMPLTPEVDESTKERYTGLDASCSAITRAANNQKTQRRFQKLQSSVEVQFFNRYRKWVRRQRDETLERFQKYATETGKSKRAIFSKVASVPLTQVLPDFGESSQALKQQIRPLYNTTKDTTFEFTLDEIGVPTFAPDDSSIYEFFEQREKLYSQSIPKTVISKLETSLTKGLQESESLFQLQMRVQEVFQGAIAPAKSLQIARTESSSFMNGVRDQMFDLQGIDREDWASAEDEATREDHLMFGEHGVENRGFNWLSVIGADDQGFLEFPGDDRAPAHQTINCRCVKIPVE